jgi:malate dehydrogenase (oxaloacetate-decarboxylating)
MTEQELALDLRKRYKGVIGVESKVPIKDKSVLSVVYTPGVAEPCKEISKEPGKSFQYTCRGNTVALVTDGSRVLELGGAGPFSALPILEGKSVIFKTFGGVEAFPICLDTLDEEEIIRTVCMLAPTFGAICIEDISSPRCFPIEERISRAMNIPVFHNDQHAAAIAVFAGLLNACKIVGKRLRDLNVVISGAGAAGIAIAKFLKRCEVGLLEDIVLCDSRGAIHKYRLENMNDAKFEIAKMTNKLDQKGNLSDVIAGADVLIGVSRGSILTQDMVETMAGDPIVFALAVPDPEIMPEEAKRGGARIVSTGRADYSNEINTALVYPGFFRGILDIQARAITHGMKVAAAEALAGLVSDKDLREDYIIPRIFDFRVAPAIAVAVAQAAMEEGVARREMEKSTISDRMERYIYEGHFPVPPKKGPYASSAEESLDLHERYQGAIEVKAKIGVKDQRVLQLLYLPPASAEPARIIAENPLEVYELTCKNNLVAVVSDGSAVLGLGNIGPRAAMPVMEGKCVLFHTFAGVEAFPICIGTQDPKEIVATVRHISPAFGGINLEDISAPRCFEVEDRLKEVLDIPVFHDDQHGTAVVVLAGLANALRIVDKKLKDIRVTINGAGAAGVAIAKILRLAGGENIILCDTRGTIYKGRREGMNWLKQEMAKMTNPGRIKGGLARAVAGSDIFVGVSIAGVLTPKMVKSMAKDPIIFAMANPTPEIMPDQALESGARIVATGRSDFDNQVNNCLGFPGIFRGALDVRAKAINEEMKLAAARALADAVPEDELSEKYIIPRAMDFAVSAKVAAAVARSAMETGVARVRVDPETVAKRTLDFVYEGKLNF